MAFSAPDVLPSHQDDGESQPNGVPRRRVHFHTAQAADARPLVVRGQGDALLLVAVAALQRLLSLDLNLCCATTSGRGDNLCRHFTRRPIRYRQLPLDAPAPHLPAKHGGGPGAAAHGPQSRPIETRQKLSLNGCWLLITRGPICSF